MDKRTNFQLLGISNGIILTSPYITGKKRPFNDGDYTRLKDLANKIGEQFGFFSLDFRKKAENNRTQDEQHIILKGGTSWKEEREFKTEVSQTIKNEITRSVNEVKGYALG